MNTQMFIGMIYELVIIFISITLLALIFRRYLEKKHKLTLYLFVIFVFFVLAIIFSWLSKVLRLYSGLDYLTNDDTIDPGTPSSWFFLRVVAFRFTFTSLAIGLVFSYFLKVEVFDEKYIKSHKLFICALGAFSVFYFLIFYVKGNNVLDLIAFVLILGYMALIYVPFMTKSLNAYKSVDNPKYKKAFLSLAIMSLSLILVLINQLIDRLFMIFMGIAGYTIFYFLAWACAIIAALSAYLGYIRPKTSEE